MQCNSQGENRLMFCVLLKGTSHWLTPAEIKPLHLQSCFKLDQHLIAKNWRKANEEKCQFETFQKKKKKSANGSMRIAERKCPYSETVECLQDEVPFVHLSAPLFILCHSHWHTATAPNQPLTAGFCLRGLIGWLTKLISTPPGAT